MKIKKPNRAIIRLIIIGIFTINLFGCSNDDSNEGEVKPEFVGTWLYDTPKASWMPESITFTLTDYIFKTVSSGAFEVSITSYDEESDHILGIVTGENDDIYLYDDGDPIELTYEITDGTSLRFNLDGKGSIGPFVKQ